MRNKPRIRFKGFTEDWEQRKLGDVTNIKTGSRNQQDSVANGKYPFFIRSEKIEKLDEYDFDTEAILVPGDGRIGEIFHYYNGKFALHQRVYKVDDFKGVDAIYLLYLFQCKFKEHALRLNAQGTVPSLRLPMFTEWNIDIPSLQEQICIGRLLNKIELMITLHQRKLEKLKLAKKALLQKLFPKNGSKFPELRFKGFADAWEQRKLCQITTRVTRKNGDQSDLPLTISAQDGLVDQRKYFNRQVASRDMSNYYLIKKGEFAYNKSYSEGYPFGAVKRLDYYDIGALSTLYILFEITDNNISSDFIVSYYMTHLWYKEISKRAAEGARNHGLLNISTEDFFDSELNIPNSIEEQVKIGNFIKQFDKFITLHQRKLDKLQDVKKGLLQKMFV